MPNKVAPQPVRQTAGGAAIALAANGALDIPDGTTMGIPVYVGDAQTATLKVSYLSANNTGAPGFVVYASDDGVSPSDVAHLNAHWDQICAVNLSGNGALSIASSGGSPTFVGYSVPVKPAFSELPAVPSGTTQTFRIPLDVRDFKYVLFLFAEYGNTGAPGSVLSSLTFQI